MNYNRNSITSPPRRVFSDHHYQRDSIVSSPSFTSSNFNNFQVGLVKVYQSDEECSTDSFSLNSKNFNDVNNIVSQVNNNNQDLNSSPSLKQSASNTTPAFDDRVLFNKWDDISTTQQENLKIPESGIERSQYVLDKIIESYQSEEGAIFLTNNVFLNRKIYQQPETILNGSVKINIIQEISSLLRKFGGDNNDSNKLSTVEPTLLYYKKLMDAFDVFQTESQNSNSSFDSDTVSTNSSIMTSKPYKTSSRESLKNSLNRTSSSIPITKTNSNTIPNNNKDLPSSPDTEKKKKRNSLILDKFRGKIKAKPKRHSLNPDTRLNQAQSSNVTSPTIEKARVNLHSRSISVSSTASSRSVKDQATIHEYIKAIENLQFTLNTIKRQISQNSGTVEQFNLVVNFLGENIVKFVMADITYLAIRFLKNSASEFV
ncbi:hypothetical protein BN7_6577 [Wickerhamomyces ciferrii]|uniref:Uncharacterized protein n=1 Tax=Wickerhamomyces ciferrii (strain ATCC 14091 / BCRC 22168 / CBS 111 / JCM 3599 / NBRC 0793 / NRRL Y-1031 F-60-10) TaxID=1206466 RepID=K0KNW7_WICCF|nr:uncharacterized protein BN7_6577 [Wickerhamomyces ciferrii]CCH46970.1 hypothetical protein BN7_6577 [Wickerhamomyces ciferrii]